MNIQKIMYTMRIKALRFLMGDGLKIFIKSSMDNIYHVDVHDSTQRLPLISFSVMQTSGQLKTFKIKYGVDAIKTNAAIKEHDSKE